MLMFVLSAVAAPAGAQSLFNAAGMGVPVEPLDGRARALGSLGIGLQGAALVPTDPAAAARFRLPTGVMASQPSWVDYSSDAGNGSFQGTRFPLMGVAYPAFSGMMTVQIGAFLDQHFTSETFGTVNLLGVPVATNDRFEQDGAVSTLNIGYARFVGEQTAVGVTLGRYAGSVVRTLTRSYDPLVGVDNYVERGKWGYTGHAMTLGVSSDLSPILRVAGSVQLPTDLAADATAETSGADGSFDLPVQFRVGASAQLAPGLVMAASAARADWSGAGEGLSDPAAAGSSTGFGVGIELSRARLLGKEAPLRFGFRRTGLPFAPEGGDASERVFTGGFGLVLNQTGEFVLAGADFAMERGRRVGGGITENFWRATLSLVLSGS
jgi:hypothetical protein